MTRAVPLIWSAGNDDMRIAVLSSSYPTDDAPYASAFVHVRCRLYQARGHEVRVFGLGERSRYEIDGIDVTAGSADLLQRELRSATPDVLAIHAPNFRTIPVARRVPCRQVSWVHGHEAFLNLSGVTFGRTRTQRLGKLLKVVPRNIIQLVMLRRFLQTQDRVVFVSKWIAGIAQRHMQLELSNIDVIPNPVDVEMFSYRLQPENQTRGVTARSLSSKKRGIDIAIRAFAGLSAASLTILGRGTLEQSYRQLIQKVGANAAIESRFMPHREMPSFFRNFGFFVAPSRVETQGVAMCEAMACGLPVVATRVGGIPEFVTDGAEGLLVPPENPAALRTAVEELMTDPDRYLRMSRAARRRVETTCSDAVVTKQELQILGGG